MEDLETKFIAHVANRGYRSGDRPVLLALSGGMDSMVLAHLLLASGIPFAAAHCNFKLRGDASDGDEAFVAAWAAARGLVCHVRSFDTKAYASEQGLSTQMAARDLRYSWFEELRRRHDYAAILTAHHAGDVAETMLINLMRGSGIAGLHGIPERNGAVIRPLLFASRAEIAEYAAGNGIEWREDASNAKADYLRNALRHDVMPTLEDLMPGAGKRMAETAARIAETEIIFRKAVARKLGRLMEQRGRDQYVPIRLLRKQEGLSALAFELFTPFGFSPDQVQQILRLMDSDSGKGVHSVTHRVIRHRDFLVVSAQVPLEADLVVIDELPAKVETADGAFELSWDDPGGAISTDPDVALLDADEIGLPLLLRTRREGDYFYPLGMGGKKKKLKRFLIDAKVPVHQKDRIRILEWDRKILWIAGMRIDERFKLRPGTKRVLKVVFLPA